MAAYVSGLVEWWYNYHEEARAQFFLVVILGLLVIGYALLSLMLDGCIGGVLGAQVIHTSEIDDAQHTVFSWGDQGARGPNNYIYHAYRGRGGGLNVSWSEDNGTTWEEEEVVASGWLGLTELRVYGIVVSSNNTTCIYFYTSDADHLHDLYLAIKWAWSGSWSINNLGYQTGATYVPAGGDLSINATDTICLALATSASSYAAYYKYYDLDTNTQTPAGSQTITSAFTSYVTENPGNGIAVTVNQSNVFWFSWIYWDGASYNMRMRDLPKSETVRSVSIAAQDTRLGSMVCLRDGTLVASYGRRQAGTTDGWGYCYVLDDATTMTKREIGYAATPDILHYYIGLSCDATGEIYLTYYDDTADDQMICHGQVQDDTSQFTGSLRVVHSTPGATDSVYARSSTCGLYPKVSTTNVNMPQTGYAFTWTWQEELGATDNYYFQICLNATWPWVDYTPVAIGNDDLTNATFYSDNYLVWDFQVTGGSAPYSWSILDQGNFTGTLFISESDGVLYGWTPNATGWFGINITVEDFYGQDDVASILIPIQAAEGGIEPEPEPEEEWTSDLGIPHPAIWWPLFLLVLFLVLVGLLMGGRR